MNEDHRYKELADFLKTRRERILPSQVGLPSGPRRRTPGLRREEVAQLAGIGLTWYTWLEQGREIRVSAQVLDSLSRILLLDRQEKIHLFQLANQPIPTEFSEQKENVNPVLQHVLDQLDPCPSLIVDARWNVIGWNQGACYIFGDLCGMNARQRNMIWAMFTEEYYRKVYVDWESHAKNLLGRFRVSCGKFVEDPWLAKFIEELKEKSPEFSAWWSLHEILGGSSVYKKLKHPELGVLEFESSNFDITDIPGGRMFVHIPKAGTDTAEKLKKIPR